ncbi:sensor histidine kinase [Rubellimicrobium arenae]|uniref:sensor histidine kinase n=1 Tax=Rubellimicrobium arenae TaxID=2817372 RepID=UPI001B313586
MIFGSTRGVTQVAFLTKMETSLPRLPGGSVLDRVADWTMAQRSPMFRWGFVAVAFVLSTAARFALDPYLPPGFPYLTFFPVIALTAFLTGSLAGGVLTVLCGLVAWYYFIPPYNSFGLTSATALALLLYVVVTATELGLIYLMRRALERLALAESAAREMALSRSLMFAELQHRVSNNLAVVGSLLSLQRREVRDPGAARALDEAAARVNVVSRLSRLLHDPQAQQIDFGAFLRSLVPDAVAAGGIGDRVKVSVLAEPVIVSAEIAVPLGLVATELLSNAIEHGFPEGRPGTIQVQLQADPDGRAARLTIRDDGPGLPPGFDLDRPRSLGLMIARQFAGQLGAELTMADEGGVVSRVELPLDAAPAA